MSGHYFSITVMHAQYHTTAFKMTQFISRLTRQCDPLVATLSPEAHGHSQVLGGGHEQAGRLDR